MAAARKGIEILARKVNGLGGVIGINTPGSMPRGAQYAVYGNGILAGGWGGTTASETMDDRTV